MDIQVLIDHWQQVRTMASRYKAGNLAVSELTQLGDAQEAWQVFACLIGYSQKDRKDLRTILSEVPDGILPSESAWQEAPFLSYCAGFRTVPITQFLLGLYFVKAQIGRVRILALDPITVQRCLNSSKGDPEEFLRCITRAEQEQRSQFATTST